MDTSPSQASCLLNFGESLELSDADKALAEQFSVKLWAGVRSNTECKTFDELRLEKYTSRTSVHVRIVYHPRLST